MKVMVTGGGGFLGQAIVNMLLERGDMVAVFNRGAYPELAALGAACHRGDIGDARAVRAALAGFEAVIHVAARAGTGLSRPDFVRANVEGTRNVIDACRIHGIPVLVHTSSPSVVHGAGDLEGVDESVPYATRFSAPYPETKAEAERMVLAANGGGLQTCALRPRLIWGPGDNQLLPRLIETNRAGRLRLSAPDKKIDTTYIENAATAHLLALDDLAGPGKSAGKPYFISNGEPLGVADMLRRLLEAAGETPRIGRISPRTARITATAVEWCWKGLRLKSDPPLSRFVIEQLSTACWFDLGAARRDLGYVPWVTIDEGLVRLAKSYRA